MSTLGLILVIILLVVLFGGGLGPWQGGPYWGTGYRGGGVVVIILIVVVVLALTGRL